MISQKQLQANRNNALKATGPQTVPGKNKVSRNAIKHGLLSQHVIVHDEKQAEFDRFRQKLLAQLEPVVALEELLVDRIAACIWRLHRAGRIEVELLDRIYEIQNRPHVLNDEEESPLESWGKAVYLDLWGTAVLTKYHRYESHIERSLFRALHELQRLQAARRGQPVAVPAVVDIDVTGVKEA